MPLAAGTRLGPYQILALIGAGGMGEVYKAHDSRLRRTVAIKTLRSQARDNPERRERFEREARTVAALEHPHICVLHDVGRQEGIDFFVTEYLEGETLADRLKRGPLPLNEVFAYGIEITDALDKAHRHRVIHRDLKPANIMLTKSGVKLLDFGLAKLKSPESVTADGLTGTASITAPGVILGTLPYMAPEQLAGQEADARSDLFALGVVLYEMISGKRAFEAESPAGVVASILDRDPPSLDSATANPSAELAWVVSTCLKKNPDERWQSAADVLLVLRGIRVRFEAGTATEHPRGKRSRLPVVALAILVGVLAIALVVLLPVWQKATQPSLPIVRFSIQPPEGTEFGSPLETGGAGVPSLAPDGSNVAFVALSHSDGQRRLWVAPLSSLGSQVLPGTEGAFGAFWSPDSSSLAFFAQGKLKRVSLRGDVHILADAGGGAGGSWNRDGTILFATGIIGEGGGLSRVSALGGPVVSATSLDNQLGETNHLWPQFLPDGKHFVYTAFGSRGSGVYTGSLDSSERSRLVSFSEGRHYSAARYTSQGYLLFTEDQTLVAVRMDAQRLTTIGDPLPVANDIALTSPKEAAFSLSDNGILSYRIGNSIDESELVWISRDGVRGERVGPRGSYLALSLSSDDSSAAIDSIDTNGQRDIWLMDLQRGTLTRFTNDGASMLPIWGPSGKDILFGNARAGPRSLHTKSFSGGEDRVLVSSQVSLAPMDWSRDGQFIIYQAMETKTKRDVWALRLESGAQPQPILQSVFNEGQGKLSPSGRWLAYFSDESGRYEIYLCSFPDARNKQVVATGYAPTWSPDGSELFYVDPSRDLMSVSVVEQPKLTISRPKMLFNAGDVRSYDVSRDGRRFLALVRSGPAKIATPITIVVNWSTGLTK
jgi:eukaryotic-like serine/threonine-protein kinase